MPNQVTAPPLDFCEDKMERDGNIANVNNKNIKMFKKYSSILNTLRQSVRTILSSLNVSL
jgi:hypothetical protein